MGEIFVDIDRIVLTDVGMAPDRSEQVRAMVGAELQRLLEKEGLPEDFRGGDIQSLEVQAMHLAEPQSDSLIANTLAMKTVQALRSIR